MRRLIPLVVAGAILTAACAGNGGPDDGLTIVTTTSILGDVAAHIVGAHGSVEVLVPTGADPHDYQPSAREIAALQRADLVIAIGLGLEEGLVAALDAAAGDGVRVLETAPALDPLPFAGSSDLDPHVWMDPLRMGTAARLIADELTAVAPSPDWAEAAEAYAADLMEAHTSIQALVEAIPEERRTLVTNHDSLGYFADRYGFTVAGVVIPGGSTLAEPSSSGLTRVVAVIDELGLPAIFAETASPAQLAAAVAAEAEHDVAVVELFIGSLGAPGTGAESLIGMLVTDAERISAALR